jgi:hypothetical protein
MKLLLALIVIVILGLSGYFFIDLKKEPTQIEDVQTDKSVSAMGYVYKNISTLSPEKEVLGGTFYVTNITADSGVGTVSYEDGHNAFTADFSYTFSDTGEVKITRFEIVE